MIRKGFILLLLLLQYTIYGYANNSFYTEENDSIYTYEYVEYNGKTICFRNYKNSVMRAYVIELCNDSIKPDGELGAIEYNYAVEDFLRESTVKETINEIRAIVDDYGKRFADVNVSISGSGELVRVSFLYYTKQKELISAKDIFEITNEIMKNTKFIPPENFGCNIIKICIPTKR
jgi:hypothetical protein